MGRPFPLLFTYNRKQNRNNNKPDRGYLGQKLQFAFVALGFVLPEEGLRTPGNRTGQPCTLARLK